MAAAEASPVGLLMAAMHPESVESLVVVNAYARALWDVDYPQGLPGPARAVGCACAIRDSARQLGFEVRSGVHTERSSSGATTSLGSEFTSQLASQHSPSRRRSGFRGP